MSKTVTLRLSDEAYTKIKSYADSDNRSLSNCVETLALRYIVEHEYADEFEMSDFNQNIDLRESLIRAHKDAKTQKGNFVK